MRPSFRYTRISAGQLSVASKAALRSMLYCSAISGHTGVAESAKAISCTNFAASASASTAMSDFVNDNCCCYQVGRLMQGSLNLAVT